MIANFMDEHNLPFAAADHLSPLLRDVFPDSQIVKQYSSARTNITSMVNLALAPNFQGKYHAILDHSLRLPFFFSSIGRSHEGQPLQPSCRTRKVESLKGEDF